MSKLLLLSSNDDYSKLASRYLTVCHLARLIGYGVYGLVLVSLLSIVALIVFLALTGVMCYRSGVLFREQFDGGWNHDVIIQETEAFIDRPLTSTTNLKEVLTALPWQRLRKLANELGVPAKTKQGILFQLLEHTDPNLIRRSL